MKEEIEEEVMVLRVLAVVAALLSVFAVVAVVKDASVGVFDKVYLLGGNMDAAVVAIAAGCVIFVIMMAYACRGRL